MQLNCLIVDDEPLAREVIASFIEKVDNLHLVGECDNAIQAFEMVRSQSIDLIFLDIQMPKLNGIEFLKALNPLPKVILTTAYREYAIESYELDVADYLLKPISFQRFLKAIDRVITGEQEGPETTLHNPDIDDLRQDHPYMFLKADRKMVKVYLKDILYIESLKDYVRIKLPQKEIISLQKISYLEQKLPEDCFVRIHRSFIVPLKKIEAFSNQAIEVGGKELPIGRNYKESVLKLLNSDSSILN